MGELQPADRLFHDCISLVQVEDQPAVLWHYTSAEALIQILESSSIHLTCHRFMNDPSEGALSRDLLQFCWRKALDRTPRHPHLDMAWVRGNVPLPPLLSSRDGQEQSIFVFSMSEKGDLLSQWARYASDGRGVALGFTIDRIGLSLARPKSTWCFGPHLSRVFYWTDGARSSPSDESRDHALTRRLSDRLQQFLLEVREPTELHNGLLLAAEGLAPSIKSQGYAEECEWRLSVETDSQSKELYHLKANRHGIAPVFTLPLHGAGIKLSNVVVGPRLGDETLWSLKWLKQKYGLEHLGISRSALSYR